MDTHGSETDRGEHLGSPAGSLDELFDNTRRSVLFSPAGRGRSFVALVCPYPAG